MQVGYTLLLSASNQLSFPCPHEKISMIHLRKEDCLLFRTLLKQGPHGTPVIKNVLIVTPSSLVKVCFFLHVDNCKLCEYNLLILSQCLLLSTIMSFVSTCLGRCHLLNVL